MGRAFSLARARPALKKCSSPVLPPLPRHSISSHSPPRIISLQPPLLGPSPSPHNIYTLNHEQRTTAEYLGISKDICDIKKLLNSKTPDWRAAQAIYMDGKNARRADGSVMPMRQLGARARARGPVWRPFGGGGVWEAWPLKKYTPRASSFKLPVCMTAHITPTTHCT